LLLGDQLPLDSVSSVLTHGLDTRRNASNIVREIVPPGDTLLSRRPWEQINDACPPLISPVPLACCGHLLSLPRPPGRNGRVG
jgi:hypothetical protein